MKKFITTSTSLLLAGLVYLSIGATGPLATVGVALYWVYCVILTCGVLCIPLAFMSKREDMNKDHFTPLSLFLSVLTSVVIITVFSMAGWVYPLVCQVFIFLAYVGLYFKAKGV
jgi:hypothetical protein